MKRKASKSFIRRAAGTLPLTVRRATLALILLTSATARAANVVGSLDCCYDVTLGIYVMGWAYDPDFSSASVSMQVMVYTDAGCTSMYGETHSFTANVSRPDVNDAKGITGNHGFSETIAIADEGTYWVRIYAYDYYSANSYDSPVVQVGSTRQVTVTSQNIINLTSETGAVTLYDGYALKGTGGINTCVSIADGATVMLRGVDITNVNEANTYDYSWAGLTCVGDAIIILADGTTNKVKGGNFEYPGILIPEGKTLTIRGNGALEAYSGSYYKESTQLDVSLSCGIGGKYHRNCGNIIIEGGNITATGNSGGGPGIGTYDENNTGRTSGYITITGGNVTAIGGRFAAGIGTGKCSSCGNITITGGTVIATGGSWAAGIGTGEGSTSSHSRCGTITIGSGVTSVTATRGIIADGYESFAIGKGYNSDNVTVNISSNLIDVTEGYTRTLWPGMVLADNDDNTEAIGLKDGQTIDVQLRGRTLYRDGGWNTLCLPFGISNFTGTPLEDATVMELDTDGDYSGNKTGFDAADGTLYLYFKDATAIEAGKPYLIKWDSGDPIVDPVFVGVTISSTAPTEVKSSDNQVTFTGQYNLFPVAADNTSVLNIGSGNAIGYAKSTLRPFRAHFELSNSSSVKGCVMSFGDDGTSISLPLDDERRTKDSEAWYTLDGRKLEGKPTQKGIYINNGLKVIVK